MTDLSAEFLSIAAGAGSLADRESDLDVEMLSALESAAEEVGRSWSKSSLGYQANVYYADFKAPPAGHMFSREWGFLGMLHGTVGDWKPYDSDEVVAYIETLAGNPDLGPSRVVSDAARGPIDALIQQARSAGARIKPPHDEYLRENLEELQRISLPGVGKLAASLMNVTAGRFPVRDMQAAEGGWQVAGHQQVTAEALYIRSPYKAARWLAEVCGRLGRHLQAADSSVEAVMVQLGGKVFIGHGGRSKEYLRLGVWLTDEGLEWEVFDRQPTAGLSTKERLSEMLDNARMAFLLMTAEDETAEGKVRARENVVHEVGLFQGRLGFTKAIVLLEDGCEEFSNISGLGQIRFPKGDIRPAFDEIRKVLQREGVLR
ncbi:TIR domain-containing protein [Plantactinospora sp. CA-294935]|uniref:TIR domain-containing protein n=1 Tax=Plantactinospora sp. CA-294935 TaxID=3240012 RepID=UPI003D9071FD